MSGLQTLSYGSPIMVMPPKSEAFQVKWVSFQVWSSQQLTVMIWNKYRCKNNKGKILRNRKVMRFKLENYNTIRLLFSYFIFIIYSDYYRQLSMINFSYST